VLLDLPLGHDLYTLVDVLHGGGVLLVDDSSIPEQVHHLVPMEVLLVGQVNAVLLLSGHCVPCFELRALRQDVQVLLASRLIEDGVRDVVNAFQRDPIRVEIRQRNDFERSIEDCKLAISLICVELVATLRKCRWEKFAARVELAETVGRVEVDVVLACGVDVLAPVVVDDSEGLDLRDLLRVSRLNRS